MVLWIEEHVYTRLLSPFVPLSPIESPLMINWPIDGSSPCSTTFDTDGGEEIEREAIGGRWVCCISVLSFVADYRLSYLVMYIRICLQPFFDEERQERAIEFFNSRSCVARSCLVEPS